MDLAIDFEKFFIIPILSIVAAAFGTFLVKWIQTKYGILLGKGVYVNINTLNGRYAFIFINLSIAFFVLYNEYIGPKYSQQLYDLNTERIIIGHSWITYDPINFDPITGKIPSMNSIKQEILWIKKAGFNGIITFSCQKFMSDLPELLKNEKMGIIMGIWNPLDDMEVARAISMRNYVDAYSVGHNRLGKDYTLKELNKTINKLRFRTKKPVSTTEHLGKYIGKHMDVRLVNIGDWIFPDAHPSMKESNSNKDSKTIIKWSQLLANETKGINKPILLKMITYPMKGISDSSLIEQKNFFLKILDGRRDVMPDLPARVSISVHSAFDYTWKQEWPFYKWDPFTGLINNDGSIRPAVNVIVRRLP